MEREVGTTNLKSFSLIRHLYGLPSSLAAALRGSLLRLAASPKWKQMHLERRSSGRRADGPRRLNKWLLPSTLGAGSTQTNAFKWRKTWKQKSSSPSRSFSSNLWWPLFFLQVENRSHQRCRWDCRPGVRDPPRRSWIYLSQKWTVEIVCLIYLKIGLSAPSIIRLLWCLCWRNRGNPINKHVLVPPNFTEKLTDSLKSFDPGFSCTTLWSFARFYWNCQRWTEVENLLDLFFLWHQISAKNGTTITRRNNFCPQNLFLCTQMFDLQQGSPNFLWPHSCFLVWRGGQGRFVG